MGKTADLTDAQKAVIDTLHKEGKSQKVIAKEAGCSQSAVSKHINGNLSGRINCGRKRCTSNRDNRRLERIIKKRPFKNLGEIHKEWTAAGVIASRATTHRRIQDMGYKCRIPCVKPVMTNRQRRKRLPWAKEKKTWTVAQWAKVLFSDEVKFQWPSCLVSNSHTVCTSSCEDPVCGPIAEQSTPVPVTIMSAAK